MSSRLSIVAGLGAGIVAALALLAGFLFVGPDPSGPLASGSPSAVASPSGPPSQAAVTASPATSPTAGASVSGGSENFHIGDAAPALVVPQVGGGTIDLSALKGTPVWVNFMQTTCEPCITEFPLMNGFAARYGEAGLVILAIDIREEEGLVSSFAQSLNATFPLGLDTDGAAQRTWRAFALPTHFWVDKDGIVRDGALGGIGADIMARGVGKILPGVEVTP
jgi:cytochrome c biogenesis protein CcmG, thiol:disulfide interchange protein DsbE